MITRRKAAATTILLTFFVLSPLIPADQGTPRFVFREVIIDPLPARPGTMVEIRVRFAVEGGPMTLTARAEQTTVASGPPPPTLVLGGLDPGEYTRVVHSFTVPNPILGRLCFTIHIGPGELRGLCLRKATDAAGASLLELENRGTWGGSTSAPRPVPSMEKPDLKLVGNIAVDDTIRLENVGEGTAYNIHIKKQCFVDGRWLPAGGDKEIRTLGPGGSIPLPIGRLGRMAFGPCASNATLVRIVADPGNLIDELDETNNVLESGSLPDLRIASFEIQRVSAVGSGAYRAVFRVHNAGPGDAPSFAWEISVNRRQDGGAGAPAWMSFVGKRTAALAAGQSVTIVEEIRFGLRYYDPLRLRVDPLGQILESDEGNNSRETRFLFR